MTLPYPSSLLGRSTWELEEILNNASVRTESSAVEDVTYIRAGDLGLTMVIEQGCCVALQFSEPANRDLISRWSRSEELSLRASRRTVRSSLGQPIKAISEQSIPVLGTMGPSDRFSLVDYQLHVQYTVGGTSVEMVTFDLGEP